MENQWLELTFSVPSDLADLVADDLYDLGCLGVTIEERQLDTFTRPDPDQDIPDYYRVKAYFPQEIGPQAVLDRLQTLQRDYPGWQEAAPQVGLLAREDWAEGWHQHFTATRFGQRLIVKPTWEELTPAAGEVLITLDPGMAFGTGSHETTRLCLQAIAELFDAHTPRTVLDVGTGSGILAMAAAALGAERVLANDIDDESCQVARDNIALNGLTEAIEVTPQPLEALSGRFDIVVANILAEENVRLAGHLVDHLTTDGWLLLSGILTEKEAFVRDGFAHLGLGEPVVTYDAEWCCLCYRRRCG